MMCEGDGLIIPVLFYCFFAKMEHYFVLIKRTFVKKVLLLHNFCNVI